MILNVKLAIAWPEKLDIWDLRNTATQIEMAGARTLGQLVHERPKSPKWQEYARIYAEQQALINDVIRELGRRESQYA